METDKTKIDFSKYLKTQYEIELGDYELKESNGKLYAIRKHPYYPSTHDACLNILRKESGEEIVILERKMNLLYQLIMYRNAYWDIAGEWEPNWEDVNTSKYCIKNNGGKIAKVRNCAVNTVLSFPTEEMRDVFYENFKDLIETNKEWI